MRRSVGGRGCRNYRKALPPTARTTGDPLKALVVPRRNEGGEDQEFFFPAQPSLSSPLRGTPSLGLKPTSVAGHGVHTRWSIRSLAAWRCGQRRKGSGFSHAEPRRPQSSGTFFDPSAPSPRSPRLRVSHPATTILTSSNMLAWMSTPKPSPSPSPTRGTRVSEYPKGIRARAPRP